MADSALLRVVAGSHPRRTAVRALVLVAGAYVIFGHVLLPVRGIGISMEPAITEGDLLFVNRVAYRVRPPERGDIVAIRVAGRSVVYVKRLLGLPGDTVSFRDGVLWRNGEAVEEAYVTKRAPWQLADVTLGADDYFVVGDNRSMPIDHHEFGMAPRDRLIGPRAF